MDLKKIDEQFQKFLKDGLSEERFDLDKIKVTEDLLEKAKRFLIPFGYLEYFLAIEDEKPVLYVNAASRMDMDMIFFMDGNSIEAFDVFSGNSQISKKYGDRSRRLKGFEEINIRKY